MVRVNWDYDPDALGRYETYGEQLGRGVHRARSLQWFARNHHPHRLPTFTDCAGPFGTANRLQQNAAGVAIIGDLARRIQDLSDAQMYVEGVLGNDLTPANCNDINADGTLTVADAAFMADCQWWNEAHTDPDSTGVHSHCEFPVNDITNPLVTHFTIASVDWDNQAFDVQVKPRRPHLRLPVEFDRVQISQTESLLDATAYDYRCSIRAQEDRGWYGELRRHLGGQEH